MYTAPVDRLNPSCFLFLIDQSFSMSDPFGADAGQKTKAQGVADALNRLLLNLVIRCTREEGVRYYYDIGVIGYGGRVGPAFTGPLSGRQLVPITEVGDNPARVETRKKDDGAGGVTDFRLPIWFDPVAENGTPMNEALRLAHSWLAPWVSAHPNSFPPLVINLTDGEASDSRHNDEPVESADSLKELSTSDGNILVFNCHISSQQKDAILFPDRDKGLPDKFARLLFDMSSKLPDGILEAAKKEGFNVGNDARGFAFNADLVDVIRFLDIGTRTATALR